MSDTLVFALIASTVAIAVVLELIAMTRVNARSLKQKLVKTESGKVEEETAKEKCSHFLGYLATHPKDQPVPDECFGCENAAECINSSSTRILSKTTIATPEVGQR